MQKFLDESGVSYFWNKIKSYIDSKDNSESGGGVDMPSRIICAWAGSSTDIPNGWTLCDGTNGTPDLRDRFILGAGTHEVGETGGEEEVTLTVNQMPEHNHVYQKITISSSNLQSGSAKYNTVGSTINPSTNTAGSSQPHPNMPPYYTLCYIMKL